MLRTSLSQVLAHEYSETKEAVREIYQFVRTHNWKATLRLVFQRKYWKWWILLAVVIAASVTLSAFHEQIATKVHPWGVKIRASHWAWIVPVVLLFIVSFPPLFGHELILLVCGMIWGLWAGFAIAAAGTFIGELGTYVAFKYFFRKKAAELEEKNIIYACCAKMMRDGGLPMLILVRFSAMPGHIVTAIQSCIGIGIWMYGVAAFVTLPKQFALCYIGKIFGDTVSPLDFDTLPEDKKNAQLEAEKHTKAQQKKISFIVFAVTIIATGIAAYLVWMRARALRPTVIAEMEARKLAREEAEAAEAGPSMSETRPGRSRSGRTLSYEDSPPPEWVDMQKWNSSRSGLLMTPDKEREKSRSRDRSSSNLGMSLASPSLPHLPRYHSRLVDGEEMLLGGRSRSGTMRSSADSAGGLLGNSSLSVEGPRTPSDERLEDYFGNVGALQSAAVSDGDATPTSAALEAQARRQSEPNWIKRDWESHS